MIQPALNRKTTAAGLVAVVVFSLLAVGMWGATHDWAQLSEPPPQADASAVGSAMNQLERRAAAVDTEIVAVIASMGGEAPHASDELQAARDDAAKYEALASANAEPSGDDASSAKDNAIASIDRANERVSDAAAAGLRTRVLFNVAFGFAALAGLLTVLRSPGAGALAMFVACLSAGVAAVFSPAAGLIVVSLCAAAMTWFLSLFVARLPATHGLVRTWEERLRGLPTEDAARLLRRAFARGAVIFFAGVVLSVGVSILLPLASVAFVFLIVYGVLQVGSAGGAWIRRGVSSPRGWAGVGAAMSLLLVTLGGSSSGCDGNESDSDEHTTASLAYRELEKLRELAPARRKQAAVCEGRLAAAYTLIPPALADEPHAPTDKSAVRDTQGDVFYPSGSSYGDPGRNFETSDEGKPVRDITAPAFGDDRTCSPDLRDMTSMEEIDWPDGVWRDEDRLAWAKEHVERLSREDDIAPSPTAAIRREACTVETAAEYSIGRLVHYDCRIEVTWLSVATPAVIAVATGHGRAKAPKPPKELTLDELGTMNERTKTAAVRAAEKAMDDQIERW